MRSILGLVVSVFFISFLFGQNNNNKYPILVNELNKAFKDDLIRGVRWSFSFSIDSLGTIKFIDFKHLSKENKLLNLIRDSKEDLSVGV